MNIDRRIVYSPEEMLRSVEGALDKLNVLRYDSQYRMLLGDHLLGRLNTWDQVIRSRKDDPLTLVVIGDFKRGKSTFINALLGEEVVPTDVTTETVTFNRISYGASGNEAVLSGKRRMRLSDSELRRDELEKIIAQTGEDISCIELRRPCEILKNITIIDTPGTGDAMRDFSEQVEEYLMQADAVVYLYSVKYPLSQSEQMFLKAAVLPQQYTKLFLVGNYADTTETEEAYHRVRKMVEERVHGLIPGAEIVTVSALDELCRQLNLERPCKKLEPILEEEFQGFRDMLGALIEDKKDTVIVDRMQRLTNAMLRELDEELASLENGVSMSGEDARRRMEELKLQKQAGVEKQEEAMRRIDSLIVRMSGDANQWMMGFLDRVRGETSNLDMVSTDDLFKYYSFYCVDLMQQAVNACIEYHTEQMFEELEEVSLSLAKDLAGDLKKDNAYHFRFNLDNKVWTKGDNVGLAVSMISASGTLTTIASLAADAVSGIMRKSEVEKKKPDVVKRIWEQMRGIESSISTTISGLYTRLGESAKKCILEYYEDELEKTQHLVEQSVAVANREEAEKDKMREAVASARNILQEAAEMVSLLTE